MKYEDELPERALEEAGPVRAAVPSVPVLRTDLKATRRGERVEVSVPENPTTFELYAIEWSVAQLMDGSRTKAQIARDSSRNGVSASPATIDSFVRELLGYGFLEVESNTALATIEEDPELSAEERMLLDTAVALQSRGDLDGAANYLLAALEINPLNSGVRDFLREVQASASETNALVPVSREEGMAALVPVDAQELATNEDDDEDEDDEESEIVVRELDDVSEQMRARARRRLLAKIGAAVFVCLIGLAFIPWPFSLRATVELEAKATRRIQAQIDQSRVARVLVTEGQRVEAGTLLLELDAGTIESQLAAAEARQKQEEAELQKLRNGSTKLELERAKREVSIRASSMRFAARELRGIRKAGDLVSRTELSEAKRAYEVARGELEKAKTELRLLRAGSRVELIRIQEAQVAEAVAKVELWRERREQLNVRASIRGVIVTPDPEKLVGQVFSLGDPLLEIGTDEELTAVFRIGKEEISYAREGAPVEFWLSSIPDEVFHTKLAFVSSSATVGDNQELFFRAKAQLDNREGRARPGMEGYARIFTEDRSLLWILSRPIVAAFRRFRAELPF